MLDVSDITVARVIPSACDQYRLNFLAVVKKCTWCEPIMAPSLGSSTFDNPTHTEQQPSPSPPGDPADIFYRGARILTVTGKQSTSLLSEPMQSHTT